MNEDQAFDGTTRGQLVLVATPIGNLADLSPRAAEVLSSADVVCCEDTRRTGRLLELSALRARRLMSLHAHNEAARIDEVLGLLRNGATVALVSDAGTPLVADPGARLVTAAIACGASVSALPGPFAGVLALVASGLAADRWRFEGFLARKGRERHTRLVEIAAAEHPSIVYESPLRLAATLSDMAEVCGEDRRVAIGRELTKFYEQIWRGSLSEAIAWSKGEPRGECVIVLDGAARMAPVEGKALDEALERLLEAGLARRDAIVACEVLLGASHRDAYSAAHRTRSDQGE